MAPTVTTRKPIRVKKRCCKSGPRCKRCPVVLQRLQESGHAAQLGKRDYLVDSPLPKAVRKRARARKA